MIIDVHVHAFPSLAERTRHLPPAAAALIQGLQLGPQALLARAG